MASLSGKKAMVTGGSRGIGAGIVTQLAKAGAAVGFTFHSRAEAATALCRDVERSGGRAFALKADSSHPAQLSAAVDKVSKELPGFAQ